LNDSGRLELFEVLAHGRLRKPCNFYEFSADAGILGRDGVNDGEARWVAKCFKEFGERKVLRGKGFGMACAH
jgi:hypothetical protein